MPRLDSLDWFFVFLSIYYTEVVKIFVIDNTNIVINERTRSIQNVVIIKLH